MKLQRVGVIGATGLVGQAIVEWLLRFGYLPDYISLFASQSSDGKSLTLGQKNFSVLSLTEKAIQTLDVALFATDAAVSRQWISIAQSRGVVCIDNSSAFRQDPSVPLVIPEVNGHVLATHPQVIASPNCSTIIALLALAPLHHTLRMKAFTACTYQAVSGNGTEGLRTLERERQCGDSFSEIYSDRIEGNVIASIGIPQGNGFTDEEEKLCHESRKILASPELQATATCVRVPVERAHSMALQARFESSVDLAMAEEQLRYAPGIHYTLTSVATPFRCAWNEDCFVSRLRKDPFDDKQLLLWTVGDQIWKGAALNVVQILNRL
ncbi:MAG: aspartate-semialdehyde dehydrogenase [Puniceicoccales bacterium]|jgi:aspartate-semialdehyde dehydrogenase|nr:aspartate-semialdehyde dehydrogenase [Puniceicoccales bacterium]